MGKSAVRRLFGQSANQNAVSGTSGEPNNTGIDRLIAKKDNRGMSKRLQQDLIKGPKGEVLTVNWMPDNRVRLTFKNCGKVTVSKVFAAKVTNIEVSNVGKYMKMSRRKRDALERA